MPVRLLREGILDSEGVNALTFPAEVFYRRLMSVVDDFGRFDGRAAVLRGRLYPLKLDTVREADISRWIAECEKAGLIALYDVGGKQYILFRKLGPARAKESKYPPPPDVVCERLKTDANGCKQAQECAPYSVSYSGSEKTPLPPAKPGGWRAADGYAARPADGTEDDPGKPTDFRGRASSTAEAEAPAREAAAGGVEAVPPFAVFLSAWVEARLKGHDAAGGPRETGTRRGWWQDRVRDPWWAGHWRAGVARLAGSQKARGLTAGFGGVTVDQFLRDGDTLAKVLEGNYDDPGGPPPTGPPGETVGERMRRQRAFIDNQ